MGRKLKLVISDFHLGKGPYREDGSVNVFEDFRADGKFTEFLDYHRSGDHADDEVELVVNGDFFNLLSVDLDGRLNDAITERVAVEKTEAIIRGHPLVFEALRRFAAAPGHAVVFMMGNHDPGILFAGVREAVSAAVGGKHAYLLDTYDFDGVHIEHGMQHEPMNAFNTQRYFVERGGELSLNLPLGSRYIIEVLNREKALRPYIDKVAPFRRYFAWALLNDPAVVFKISAKSVDFALRAMLKKIPYVDEVSPTEILQRLVLYTAFPTLEREAKHLLGRRGFHTVIMGHTHVPLYREYARDRVYINTGTWNAMTSLDMGSLGRTTQLTYAHVEWVEGRPRARLREWRGLQRPAEDVFF
ncbi:metallophosphoesterase [Anaeromyxobacter diazotrophicus]|uniref:UDP-2,3-diacylglucosamine hydrolase n=1 Tax=Anaeromyxobacter diazotrophicus TaxID=2590199 RepID=A0A7I9VQK2_9BACT|nr:metallophosphoesterase [Anaeromyxobacter diazotrophicus]GEJ58257.1 UDP-2,3-diacylglucosamine hydrolase [Anaeromyxobacter diazotrophicus]